MQKLIIRNLHKSYGHLHILQGVNLELEAGEVAALIGSSGSGKSTLLRCINQLEQADQGSIHIDNECYEFSSTTPSSSTAQQQKLRKKIGMVFQSFNLWAHMSLLHNLITAPIRVNHEAKASATLRAMKLLERVGIANKKDCYPVQLSGGQQQRGAIARALMMQPEAILFDEPTSALDPEMVAEVLAVIQDLAQEHGMIMLIATHELNFARKIATQTVFLDQGKIIESGTTERLFTHPQTTRLQEFLQSAAYHASPSNGTLEQ